MVSSVAALLVCALSVSLIPPALADDCLSYTGLDGKYNVFQMCYLGKFCCGTCTRRYCCDTKALKISEDAQERCPQWPDFKKKTKIIVIIGAIIGALVPILICVGLIVCFVAPCCLLYKKCRKRHRQGQQVTGTVTTVVNTPLQPVSPHGYQPAHPGYQPVPVYPGPGGVHNVMVPPPYVGPTGPMQPSQPSQAYGPPPEEFSQPPFNPAYDPHS